MWLLQTWITITSISFLDHCDSVSVSWTSGTDEAAIIEVLSSRTSEERQQIKQKYKEKYGKVGGDVPASASVTHPGRENTVKVRAQSEERAFGTSNWLDKRLMLLCQLNADMSVLLNSLVFLKSISFFYSSCSFFIHFGLIMHDNL
jgi:hypothetical protein